MWPVGCCSLFSSIGHLFLTCRVLVPGDPCVWCFAVLGIHYRSGTLAQVSLFLVGACGTLSAVHRIFHGLPLLSHSSSIVCYPCGVPGPGQGIVLDDIVPSVSAVVDDQHLLMVLG